MKTHILFLLTSLAKSFYFSFTDCETSIVDLGLGLQSATTTTPWNQYLSSSTSTTTPSGSVVVLDFPSTTTSTTTTTSIPTSTTTTDECYDMDTTVTSTTSVFTSTTSSTISTQSSTSSVTSTTSTTNGNLVVFDVTTTSSTVPVTSTTTSVISTTTEDCEHTETTTSLTTTEIISATTTSTTTTTPVTTSVTTIPVTTTVTTTTNGNFVVFDVTTTTTSSTTTSATIVTDYPSTTTDCYDMDTTTTQQITSIVPVVTTTATDQGVVVFDVPTSTSTCENVVTVTQTVYQTYYSSKETNVVDIVIGNVNELTNNIFGQSYGLPSDEIDVIETIVINELDTNILSVSRINPLDFCFLSGLGSKIANGTQQKFVECSITQIGILPDFNHMPSTIILEPANGAVISLGTNFTVTIKSINVEYGLFDNPENSYLLSPQTLNSNGVILGHNHIVLQRLFDSSNPPNPSAPEFFVGLNGNSTDGTLSTIVDGSLFTSAGQGLYRLCTMTASRGHMPVIAPVARHGTPDDCIRIEIL